MLTHSRTNIKRNRDTLMKPLNCTRARALEVSIERDGGRDKRERGRGETERVHVNENSCKPYRREDERREAGRYYVKSCGFMIHVYTSFPYSLPRNACITNAHISCLRYNYYDTHY